MNKMGMVVNLGDDSIHWKGGEIKDLKITSTGHCYCNKQMSKF